MSTWAAGEARRADPAASIASVPRAPASLVERAVIDELTAVERPSRAIQRRLRISTADRSFGAGLSGALERGAISTPIRLDLAGAAGQSFGAFLGEGIALRLTGQANDYVGKGLSGGKVVVLPEPDLATVVERQAIVGNTCLYGATAGRLHVVGRAGMRFAVRNSGASAVVEGVGPHACEYMTGGIIVVLGPIGANFGAGMTGGQAFLLDGSGRHAAAVDRRSVTATRLSTAAERSDGESLVNAYVGLLTDHAAAGSGLAERVLAAGPTLGDVWLVEPIAVGSAIVAIEPPSVVTVPQPRRTRIGADRPVVVA